MQTDQNLLIAAYKAFNARDIDSVLAMMHPDVDWPNAAEGTRIHGRAGVRDYWTRQWSIADPHVEPVCFATDQAGQTIVQVHQVVRDLAGATLLDQTVYHIYSIRDGLISNMHIRST
jgi:ketosteroid isomerase-like protein